MPPTPRPPTADDIRRMLAALGPAKVWRPVLGPDGTRIAAAGDGREIPELDDYIEIGRASCRERV